jgi:hypothetical protein
MPGLKCIVYGRLFPNEPPGELGLM